MNTISFSEVDNDNPSHNNMVFENLKNYIFPQDENQFERNLSRIPKQVARTILFYTICKNFREYRTYYDETVKKLLKIYHKSKVDISFLMHSSTVSRCNLSSEYEDLWMARYGPVVAKTLGYLTFAPEPKDLSEVQMGISKKRKSKKKSKRKSKRRSKSKGKKKTKKGSKGKRKTSR